MFEGVFTAIVTPFRENGEVDWPVLASLVESQVDAGVAGIVPVGTTGESPTLTMEEHIRVISEVTRRTKSQCLVIAGTGANSTAEALELTRAAIDIGCDATLQVTPYYNKPNDAGLLQHFTLLADLGLPVMLYNIPGRSGKALSLELVKELAEHENIVAIKEAAGHVLPVSEYLAHTDLDVFSGDDPLTLPMMALGAKGVVSVASNIIPEVMVDLVRMASTGHYSDARELHDKYLPLFQALFMETNPIPVKTALALQGRIQPQFRLPLAPMKETQIQQLQDVLSEYDLI